MIAADEHTVKSSTETVALGVFFGFENDKKKKKKTLPKLYTYSGTLKAEPFYYL